MPNTKRNSKETRLDTDEESGSQDGTVFPDGPADIRQVGSAETGTGYEASFLVVGPGEEVDANSLPSWKGTWLCRPYKRERLLEEIYAANRKGSSGHAAVLNTLKNTGVMIFIIDSKISTTTADIVDSLRNVIDHLSNEERARPTFNPSTSQRCLLYRDHEGRFFNLTLADHTTAQASQWKGLLDSFSSFQATAILALLARSFGCATEKGTALDQFRPAYLSMILGLVFSEEISLSWTNVAMFVRGMPSISALSVTSNVQSDWLRKGIVLILALAGATTGNAQFILTMLGISMAAAVLLANLGSRSWRFLQWRPLAYAGPFQSEVAFLAAMATGALFPYLGHRQVEAGGKAAMESVIRIAFMVAVIFVISDYDEIQKFLVIGSEACNQDFVNIAVGAWWAVSLVASLFLVLRVEPQGIWPDDEEPLLEEDHASPVGFKVPNLPDFPIDPTLANPGLPVIDIRAEFCFGVLMALAVGGGICFLGFTSEDEGIASNLKNSFV